MLSSSYKSFFFIGCLIIMIGLATVRLSITKAGIEAWVNMAFGEATMILWSYSWIIMAIALWGRARSWAQYCAVKKFLACNWSCQYWQLTCLLVLFTPVMNILASTHETRDHFLKWSHFLFSPLDTSTRVWINYVEINFVITFTTCSCLKWPEPEEPDL